MKTAVQKHLFRLRDEQYAAFQAKITPEIPLEKFIGIRVPQLRKFAKGFFKESESKDFMAVLPHYYFEENMLHGLLIEQIKDYRECVEELNKFLPRVDNWAVCDIVSPKIFARHKQELLPQIKEWTASPKLYTCRFGLGMLMRYFLDEDFRPEYLKIPASVPSGEYYLDMMVAWFFATALAKQWEVAVLYIEKNLLDKWIHNKTIQKARESYRITAGQKTYLKSLKR